MDRIGVIIRIFVIVCFVLLLWVGCASSYKNLGGDIKNEEKICNSNGSDNGNVSGVSDARCFG